ncbi:hypothetical protein QL285_072040 [Trifolium repens]|nr:hypothetical protein QL285_072040 [Trifolium repens]
MSPPYGDFPSLISHQQIVEEEIESDDEVDQFDSQFVPICATAILQDDFPFDYFERETTRNFLQQLNPHVVLPPPNVIEAYVSDLYTEEKLKLKQELATNPNRISLSFDFYSSKSTSFGVQTPIHDLFDELKMHHQELDTETGKSQLDIYLDEPGSHFFNKYKDRILPMDVETRICTRSWLYNFVSNDREDDDDDDDFEEMMKEFDGDDDDDDDGEDGDE